MSLFVIAEGIRSLGENGTALGPIVAQPPSASEREPLPSQGCRADRITVSAKELGPITSEASHVLVHIQEDYPSRKIRIKWVSG